MKCSHVGHLFGQTLELSSMNLTIAQQAIIRAIPFVKDDAVLFDFSLPDTMRGRDAATSVRNGTLTGLSIEFRSLQEGRRDGLRIITQARLLAAALVDVPPTAPLSWKSAEQGVTEDDLEILRWL